MSQSLCCGFWCFLLFLYFKIKSNVPLVSYRKAYETDNITMYSNDLVTVHAKKNIKEIVYLYCLQAFNHCLGGAMSNFYEDI